MTMGCVNRGEMLRLSERGVQHRSDVVEDFKDQAARVAGGSLPVLADMLGLDADFLAQAMSARVAFQTQQLAALYGAKGCRVVAPFFEKAAAGDAAAEEPSPVDVKQLLAELHPHFSGWDAVRAAAGISNNVFYKIKASGEASPVMLARLQALWRTVCQQGRTPDEIVSVQDPLAFNSPPEAVADLAEQPEAAVVPPPAALSSGSAAAVEQLWAAWHHTQADIEGMQREADALLLSIAVLKRARAAA